MSLVPIDWENRPHKHCFAPCPKEVWCECRERMKYEMRKARALMDQPIIPPTEEQVRKVWDACIQEGRCARICGLGIEHCPPFVDEDMAVSWRMGWTREDEERKPKT